MNDDIKFFDETMVPTAKNPQYSEALELEAQVEKLIGAVKQKITTAESPLEKVTWFPPLAELIDHSIDLMVLKREIKRQAELRLNAADGDPFD